MCEPVRVRDSIGRERALYWAGDSMGVARETHRVDEGRLTDLDYARIDDAVGARCADLVSASRRGFANTRTTISYRVSGDVLSLTRLAHHSIGCSAADLRDAELVLIDQQVDAIVSFYDAELVRS